MVTQSAASKTKQALHPKVPRAEFVQKRVNLFADFRRSENSVVYNEPIAIWESVLQRWCDDAIVEVPLHLLKQDGQAARSLFGAHLRLVVLMDERHDGWVQLVDRSSLSS